MALSMAAAKSVAFGFTRQSLRAFSESSSVVPPTAVARNGVPIVRHSPTAHGLFSINDGITHNACGERDRNASA